MRSYRITEITSIGISLILLVGCWSTTNVTFTGSHIKPRAFGPGANSKLKDVKGKLKDLDKTYAIDYEKSNKTLTVKTFTGFGADRPTFSLHTDKDGNIHFNTSVLQKNQADATSQIFRHVVWAYMLSGMFESLSKAITSAWEESQITDRTELGTEKDIKIEEINAME